MICEKQFQILVSVSFKLGFQIPTAMNMHSKNRCVQLHTKVCLITHQGVYILHTFLHSFRKHTIVC
jgi:hypothetical protein